MSSSHHGIKSVFVFCLGFFLCVMSHIVTEISSQSHVCFPSAITAPRKTIFVGPSLLFTNPKEPILMIRSGGG